MDGGGEKKGPICVTGGTGFIGSWLIKKLLDDGYFVRTTIRSDPGHKRDISFLTNLPQAPEKLQIFTADLSDPQSFHEALEGSTGVLHVATPIDFEKKEPIEVVTKRTIDGALGILKACLESKTVKRVVYTSSASAVFFNDTSPQVMDESVWSDIDFVKSLNTYATSYIVSKTLTEKAVLEFAQEHGLDLVTLVPSFVVGPFICPKFPGSVRSAMAMILGDRDEYAQFETMQMVHVDDVARAHIFLLECPDATGRYICSSDVLTMPEMSEYLSTRYPEFTNIPTVDSLREIEGAQKDTLATKKILSTKKLLDLGFRYKYGIDEMYDDAIQSCRDKGFV